MFNKIEKETRKEFQKSDRASHTLYLSKSAMANFRTYCKSIKDKNGAVATPSAILDGWIKRVHSK